MTNKTISPIRTRYDGILFRSRTEARWALFFKTLNLRYEYEKEGYELPSGRYLPDFFLPDLDVWFEVKGQDPTHDEVKSCINLHIATGKRVLLAVGSPTPKDQIIVFPKLHWGFDDGDKIWMLAHSIIECEDDWGVRRGFFIDDWKVDGDLWIINEQGDLATYVGLGDIDDRYPGMGNGPTVDAYETVKTHSFWR